MENWIIAQYGVHYAFGFSSLKGAFCRLQRRHRSLPVQIRKYMHKFIQIRLVDSMFADVESGASHSRLQLDHSRPFRARRWSLRRSCDGPESESMPLWMPPIDKKNSFRLTVYGYSKCEPRRYSFAYFSAYPAV
jgi:hypothetical protein